MDNKTKRQLLDEIEQALGSVKFGSVEIYVSDDKVTQITVRKITKTSIDVGEEQPAEFPEKKTFTVQAHFRRSE